MHIYSRNCTSYLNDTVARTKTFIEMARVLSTNNRISSRQSYNQVKLTGKLSVQLRNDMIQEWDGNVYSVVVTWCVTCGIAAVLLPLGCKRLARFSSHFFCHLHYLIRHWFKAIFNVLALLPVHILDLATLLNVDKDATL